jgi:hypothetical protein
MLVFAGLLIVFLPAMPINSLRAQSIPDQSTLTFHLDKPFYVNGEIIWYKVYLPAGFQGHDVMLKLSLRADAGRSVEEYFLKTEGKTSVHGYFKLPYDVEPAVYHFLVMGTDSASKKRVKLGEMSVPVYNDLDESWEKQETVAAVSGAGPALVEGLRLDVQLTEAGIQKRAEVNATVQVSDSGGRPLAAEVSVSVRDEQLLPVGGTIKRVTVPPAGDPAALDPDIYINGRLTDAEGRPRAGVTFGVYASDERSSFLGETDPQGYFALHLPEFTGNKPIQFVDLRGETFKVEIEDGISIAEHPKLVYTENVKNYLEWSRGRKLIYQLYQTVETGLQIEKPVVEARELIPDYHIGLKDYTAFDDLYTFLTEVSTPLKLRKENDGSLYARMFNPDPRVRVFYQDPPIFIVDGKITRNVNFLQDLDITKLEVIDEFFDFNRLNTYFGKLGSNGVVVVETSIPNLQLPETDEATIFSVSGLLPEATLLPMENVGSQQPVFKPQLFWLAGGQTNSQGQLDLRFPHSDDLGTFVIEVTARSEDGKMGYTTRRYQVSW